MTTRDNEGGRNGLGTPMNDAIITTLDSSMSVVSELPEKVITKLIKIAENCVIKSSKISRDEIPDFVQNCLLKLLYQIDQQRLICSTDGAQHYIVRKNDSLVELERWFGTTALNISIDYYRRVKNVVVGLTFDQPVDESDHALMPIFIPEPDTRLEDELRQHSIQEMATYCADNLDSCMDDAWKVTAQGNYKNFTLSFTEQSNYTDKGLAVADYCRIIINEKYTNDGKKSHRHNSVCETLGLIIPPENMTHKKKRFEKIMMQCIEEKVNDQFQGSVKTVLKEDDSRGYI
jgi:hypothetical protein